MRKVFILVTILLIGLFGMAQSPIGDSLPVKQNVANAPNTLLQTNALKLAGGIQFGYFVDTTAANASTTKCKYYPNAFISTLSGTWKRNSTASKWEKQATVSDITNIVGCNSLLTGGVVTYSGSGLIFDISPANYFINCGGIYHSSQSQKTLAAADPSLPRVDVIAVDTSGAVVVITGTPAADPVKPQINATSQLELTHIDIAAGATTPGGVTTVIIYDENTEWATSSSNVTANFNNTANPFHATKSVLATSVINGSTFKFDYGSADVNVSNYSALKIYIRTESSSADYGTFYVKFGYNGTILGGVTVISGTYGFTSGLDGAYQVLTIPISDFPLSSNISNELYIQMGSVGFTSCYLDYIQLQGGISSGNSPYLTNIFRKPGTDSVFQVINNVPVFAYKDSLGGGTAVVDTFSISTRAWRQKGDDSLGAVINLKPKVYNVKAYGAVGDGVTDDTNPIQTAINECNTNGGGTVYFPNGVYIINGALQNEGGSNSQLYIPLNSYTTPDSLKSIKFLGESQPNWFSDPLYSKNSPVKGVILKSTLRHTGAILGVATETVVWGSWNFAQLSIENMIFRVSTDSLGNVVGANSTAIDASRIINFEANHVRCDIDNAYESLEPYSTAYGIKMPVRNNFCEGNVRHSNVTGYYTGITLSEHTTIDDVLIDACYNGIEYKTSYHSSHINKIVIARCVNVILVSGILPIQIDNLDVEWKHSSHAPTGAWFNTQTVLKEDVVGSLGNINYTIIQSGCCLNNSLFNRTNAATSKINCTPITGKLSTLLPIGTSPNANGATITDGFKINLEPASATYGGIMSNTTQTIAGAKTFNTEGFNVTKAAYQNERIFRIGSGDTGRVVAGYIQPTMDVYTAATGVRNINFINYSAYQVGAGSSVMWNFGTSYNPNNMYTGKFYYNSSGGTDNAYGEGFFNTTFTPMRKMFASGNMTIGTSVTTDNGYRLEVGGKVKINDSLLATTAKVTLPSGYTTNINGSLGINDFATKGYADSVAGGVGNVVDGGSFSTSNNYLTITQSVGSDIGIRIAPSFIVNPINADSILFKKNDSTLLGKAVSVSVQNVMEVTTTRTDSTIDHKIRVRETFLDSIRTGKFGGSGTQDVVKLMEGSVSGATMDIDFSSYVTDYDIIEVFFFNVIPATDAVTLNMRMASDGTTFSSGGSDYKFSVLKLDAAGIAQNGSSAASAISLTPTNHVGNGSSTALSGSFKIFSPNVATFKPMINGSLSIASYPEQVTFFGQRDNAQTLKGVRFLFSSGNISGNYKVIGYKTTP